MLKVIKKVARQIFNIILNTLMTIMVVVMLLVVYNFIQIKVQHKSYSNLFGFSVFEVTTGSMSGSIEIGDIIITKILPNTDELEVDDIIVFTQDNYVVTHRIVEIKEKEIRTKGDANNVVDMSINKEQVIGKVVVIMPNVGVWKRIFATPKVYILLIITITVLGIAFTLKDNSESKIKRRTRQRCLTKKGLNY